MKRKIKIKILIVATVVKNIISSASSTKSQKLFFFSLHIQIFQTGLFLTPSASSVFFRLRRFDDAVAICLCVCVGVVGITRVDQVVCRRVLFAVQRRLLGVGLSSVVRRWRRRRCRRWRWCRIPGRGAGSVDSSRSGNTDGEAPRNEAIQGQQSKLSGRSSK